MPGKAAGLVTSFHARCRKSNKGTVKKVTKSAGCLRFVNVASPHKTYNVKVIKTRLSKKAIRFYISSRWDGFLSCRTAIHGISGMGFAMCRVALVNAADTRLVGLFFVIDLESE